MISGSLIIKWIAARVDHLTLAGEGTIDTGARVELGLPTPVPNAEKSS